MPLLLVSFTHSSVCPFPSLTREQPDTRNPCSTITADFSPMFTPKTKITIPSCSKLLSFLHSFICKLIKYQVLCHIYFSTSRLTHFTSSGNVSFFCPERHHLHLRTLTTPSPFGGHHLQLHASPAYVTSESKWQDFFSSSVMCSLTQLTINFIPRPFNLCRCIQYFRHHCVKLYYYSLWATQ